ncbi:hypothetical protein SAMN02910447_00917 [Ruminococcus sp. YE71]|uniref:CPBP family intramembrane glutamic endopeptidase n=1 Tax=unclassified Ruminococcus TaxID=2608920 RepID=UPI00088D536E|nr:MULTISPECIES: type II CAAX endopeptidase family protein [unclassified Ruminococcus]SDA15383.1 hypothetical protein SAMN02910446_00916 [Ruminococcus sp. YE78]SFW22443.1 hypothetical protein SAMN02910447_00917 [Ruminococcus sp. YE71]
MEKKKTSELLLLAVAFFGVMGGLATLFFVGMPFAMKLSVSARMPLVIVMRWALMLVPAMIMILREESFREFLPEKEKLGRQIVTGAAVGAAFSAVMTLIPHLAGFGESVSAGYGYKYLWQFAFEFINCIFCIGLTEEFIFRGYFYSRLERIFGSTAAVAGSSVLFGLFHLFGGNIVQMILTGLLGAAWCICRKKIPHCTLLSLIIAHGLYDFLIHVWEFVFS